MKHIFIQKQPKNPVLVKQKALEFFFFLSVLVFNSVLNTNTSSQRNPCELERVSSVISQISKHVTCGSNQQESVFLYESMFLCVISCVHTGPCPHFLSHSQESRHSVYVPNRTLPHNHRKDLNTIKDSEWCKSHTKVPNGANTSVLISTSEQNAWFWDMSQIFKMNTND